MKNQPIYRRFLFAWDGLKASWQSEKSVRVHGFVICCAVSLLILFRPHLIWWALVLLAGGMMLATELVNTAVEKLVDHLHPDIHPVIKVVKDTLAAAVFITCVAGGAVLLAFLWSMIR